MCGSFYLSKTKIDKALKVFDEDMQISEFGNPSVVSNCDGTLGLDFWNKYYKL